MFRRSLVLALTSGSTVRNHNSNIYTMLILGEKQVQQCLSLVKCLEINKVALQSLANPTEKMSQQQGVVPTRLGLPYPKNDPTNSNDWTFFKPAALYTAHSEPRNKQDDDGVNDDNEEVIMGMKVVSVRANNPKNHNLPLVPGTIMLLNAETGLMKCTMGGTYLTAARTSAGPAIAVQQFKPNVQHLVIFGAGMQAKQHILLMDQAIQRIIPKITIVNRTEQNAESLKEFIVQNDLANDNINRIIDIVELNNVQSVNQALSTADVISATTNTNTPLFQDGSVVPSNCLITGIGSYTPNMQEFPSSLVDRCHVVIDTPEAKQVGDLKHLQQVENHPITLMGEALLDPTKVSTIPSNSIDCIFYKAVGTAIQDVLTANVVYEAAQKDGIGTIVDIS